MKLTLAALCGFAFVAGFVDAVAGGGGLIQVPALLVLLPQTPLPTIFGTNKFSSVWGTSLAAVQYARRVPIHWAVVLPAAFSALIFSYAGSWTLGQLSSEFLRPYVLAMLVVVLLYTLWNKNLGAVHAPRFGGRIQITLGILIGALLGFYDGFFGPGAGSFLIFAFVGVLGFDFLAASATAKIINVVTNLASLAYFSSTGHILYGTAIAMAVCNAAGGWLGSHLAIRKGNRFVRTVLILMSSALLLRLGWDALRP